MPRKSVADDILKKAGVEDEGEKADIGKLVARIDGLEKDLEQARRTNAALMTQAPVVGSDAQTETGATGTSFDVNLDDLPDPSEDRAAYNKALGQKINSIVTGAVKAYSADVDKRRKAAEEKAASTERLWEDFSKGYPDLSKHRKLANMAAADIWDSLNARGVDADKYIRLNREQFFKDVAAALTEGEYAQYLPKEEKKPEEDSGEDDGEDAGRTAGMFGGLESGGTPTKKGKGKEDLGSISEDLTEMQRKSGLF